MYLLEIQLLSADIAQTRHFYHDVIGMDIQYSNDTVLKLSAGLSSLVFMEDRSASANYHFAFNIPSNKFEEAYEWAGASLELLPVKDGNTVADFKNWNAKAFYFYDNNGNIVEFISRFDLDNGSGKSFDGSSVTSVSEMGLVADDARKLSLQLMRDHKLPNYFRQPPQDDFIAIGDDNGLFIVVNSKRHWYPTDRPAVKSWASIKFSHDGNIYHYQMSAQ